MVTITLSETYDLSTKINKMTLIGIHTPTRDIIKRTYPGLAVNHKFFHIDHVSVRLAAVSTLPVSPDQVGADATDIAPEDMLNPILYKAVTNESWSTIEARLNGLRSSPGDASGSMLDYTPDKVTDLANEFQVYYALLANRSGFKIAHPQQGLTMNRLVPLVFDRWYTHGQNGTAGNSEIASDGLVVNASGLMTHPEIVAQSMRGRPHKLPRMNTTYITSASGTGTLTNQERLAMGVRTDNDTPLSSQTEMPNIPPLYCGLILMPPAKRTIMFYRLVVSAQITFSGVRPVQDVLNFACLSAQYGQYVYHSDYATQSKAMSVKTDLVDVQGADMTKIMEG